MATNTVYITYEIQIEKALLMKLCQSDKLSSKSINNHVCVCVYVCVCCVCVCVCVLCVVCVVCV